MGFVVILLGVFVTSRFGFEDQINVMVGTSREVGHDTGLVVTAESFSDTYDESGAPIDYVSELVLERNGEVIEAREVRVNTPLRYDGVKIHQDSFGVAAGVRITDADGEVVFDDGAPLLWTSPDGANSIGRIDLPEHDLEVIVLTAASGQAGSSLEPGELQIEVYAADDTAGPESVEQVYQGEAVTVGDLTYRFERENKYTGLMVRGDPGAVWVWLGAAMLTVGMTMTFGLPHRRLWVRVQPSGGGSVVRVASAEKADSRYERWFAGLVADLSPAGASTRPPHKPREKAAHDAS
jgi:cytochrome c biogenesis protein